MLSIRAQLATKIRILLLALQTRESQMSRLHGRKLLVVTGDVDVLVIAHGLVAAAVLVGLETSLIDLPHHLRVKHSHRW